MSKPTNLMVIRLTVRFAMLYGICNLVSCNLENTTIILEKSDPEISQVRPSVNKIENSNPEQDFKRAILQNEIYFVGASDCFGLGLQEMPLSFYTYNACSECSARFRYSIILKNLLIVSVRLLKIPNILNEGENKIVWNYVAQYNRLVLQYLQEL